MPQKGPRPNMSSQNLPRGRFGEFCGTLSVTFGYHWEVLRHLLGACGGALGPLGEFRDPLGDLWVPFGRSLGSFGEALGMPWDLLGEHAKNIPKTDTGNRLWQSQNPSKTCNCHQFSHVAKSPGWIPKCSQTGGEGGLPHIRGEQYLHMGIHSNPAL